MWTFEQNTGAITYRGAVLEIGYAGLQDGKNNPAMEAVHDKGPLPRGRYKFGPPHKHPTLGIAAMQLIPDPANEMFGRSGFYWHGDSRVHPGEASHGCLVSSTALRLKAWASGEHDLEVI